MQIESKSNTSDDNTTSTCACPCPCAIEIKTDLAQLTKVRIIRHSARLDQSNYFTWQFMIGQYGDDSSLSTDGYTMAITKGQQLASEGLKFKHVFCSPYKRTIATGTQFLESFPESTIVIEPLLAEEQLSKAHIIELYNKPIPCKYNGVLTEFSFPETVSTFNKRVQFIVSKLIEDHGDSGDIVMVTHGAIVKSYASYVSSLFPDLGIDTWTAPYLTTLSFTFDKSSQTIVKDSVKMDLFSR